jgi:hypothetical protein
MGNFYGPFHYVSIHNNGIIQANINQKGIYIWGFVYEIDKLGNLKDIIDFSNNIDEFDSSRMKFIPYYVGLGKNTSIWNRLIQHHQPTIGNGRKYIRLSSNYMRSFFNDPEFPIKYKRIKNNELAINHAVIYPGEIEYFNDGDFLNLVYPNNGIPIRQNNNQNWPITNYNFINDNLDVYINNRNNFWFCYMPIDDINDINILDAYEAATFYGLKGITISETKRFHFVDQTIQIQDQTLCDIFKLKENNIVEISDVFPGY